MARDLALGPLGACDGAGSGGQWRVRSKWNGALINAINDAGGGGGRLAACHWLAIRQIDIQIKTVLSINRKVGN